VLWWRLNSNPSSGKAVTKFIDRCPLSRRS
jgi:hypothetical protein